MDTKLVMFPSGHSRNTECDLKGIMQNKFDILGKIALDDKEYSQMLEKLTSLENLKNDDLQNLYDCNIKYSKISIDDK